MRLQPSLAGTKIKEKEELMIDPPRCPSGKSMSPRLTRTPSREWNKYVSPVVFLQPLSIPLLPITFLIFPFIKQGADGRYTKYVTKNTGQLETMLKVILAPDVRFLTPIPTPVHMNGCDMEFRTKRTNSS